MSLDGKKWEDTKLLTVAFAELRAHVPCDESLNKDIMYYLALCSKAGYEGLGGHRTWDEGWNHPLEGAIPR